MNDFGARFLVTPSLFPARIAGETWGDESLLLPLPGGPYVVSGMNARQRAQLIARFATFVGDAETVRDEPFELLVHRAFPQDFLAIDTRAWSYSLDLDFSPAALAIAGMRVMARLDLQRNRGAVWTASDDDEFIGIVENVLRPLVAMRLIARGGLLVHSAAVGCGGEGLLFAGQSGAGKSTVAALAVASSLPVLSDDLNAIIREGNRFTLLPLPFTGDLDVALTSRTPLPLAAVIRLEQGGGEALRPMARAEAVSLLIRSSPYVNRDPLHMPLLLERAAEIMAASAAAVLTFRRDGDIWPILRPLCPSPSRTASR